MEIQKLLIAYCGVDCSICSDYTSNNCPGCRQTAWSDADTCFPVECCRKKEVLLCGECHSFPCVDMKGFYEESESHKEAYARMVSIRKENC